jgi:hypothetical protein
MRAHPATRKRRLAGIGGVVVPVILLGLFLNLPHARGDSLILFNEASGSWQRMTAYWLPSACGMLCPSRFPGPALHAWRV